MIKTEQLDQNFKINDFEEDIELDYYYPTTSKQMNVYGLLDRLNLCRFPKEDLEEIEKENPNVCFLAKDTSGACITFRTNSKKLVLEANVGPIRLINSMPLTGITGFDIYIKKNNKWKYLNVTRIDYPKNHIKFALFDNFSGTNDILIHFPLYNSVENIRIGLTKGAMIEALEERKTTLVIYGTSLTQGGCASRPGNSFVNMISRETNYNIYNFGFSGNGLGEKSVIDAICKIKDVEMFIIDYDANAGSTGSLFTTLEPIVQKIRMTYPSIPILIISRIPYVLEEYFPSIREKMVKRRNFQENFVKECQKIDKRLFYLDGEYLLGEAYNDCYADDIHLNDLGFRKLADGIKNKIIKILKENNNA